MNLSAGAGWGLAAAGIVACSLLLHLPVSDVFDGLARRYGFAEYDAATRAVFLVAGLAILGWLWSGTQSHGPVVRRATAAIVGLLALGQAFIVVNGIEAIHYPQYALLTWVLARAGIGLERSWLAATLLGAADETWQWLTLPRAVPGYLDWNDIILNALGAALGVLMIVRSARASEAEPVWPRRRLAGIVTAAGVAALAAGPLVESPFYRMTPGGRWFHLLSPFSAVVALALVWLVVRGLATGGRVVGAAANGTRVVTPARAWPWRDQSLPGAGP